MYTYKTSIIPIDDELGGLRATTNVLVLAPSISHAKEIAYMLAKPEEGEWTVVISTDERTAEVFDAFKRLGVPKSRVGIIDAITKTSVSNIEDSARIKFVASPVDLTGAGIKFSTMVEEMWKITIAMENPGPLPPPVRLCVLSLSTLLMYNPLETIYRFLHVITAQMEKLEGLGVYVLSSGSFDEKTISTLKQLMDIIIEIKSMDDGVSIQHYIRIMGIPGKFNRWMRYTLVDDRLEIVM